MSDQGESYLASGCPQCGIWHGNVRVQPAFVITERRGHRYWTCPMCKGDYAELAAPSEVSRLALKRLSEETACASEYLGDAQVVSTNVAEGILRTAIVTSDSTCRQVQGLSESEVLRCAAESLAPIKTGATAQRFAAAITRALAAKNGWKLGEGHE